LADDILDELDEDFDDDMSDVLEEGIEDEAEDDDAQAEAENDKEADSSSRSTRVVTTVKRLLQKMTGSPKVILILAAGIITLICITVVLWLFVFNSSPDDLLQPVQETQQTSVSDIPEEEIAIPFEDIVELEPFERIKLKTSSTMGMVTLHLSLELIDAGDRKQIYSMEDRIRNIVTQQLGNTTWLELRNPEGKIILKYNILRRINAIFPNATVRNVYFTYFLMQ